VHLIAAAPNGLTVEYMPWSLRLFEDAPRPRDGQLTVPSAPGLGLTFNREIIERYAAR
jgi:L-alanine-DL-glutamate epimerase-like enolase superfamily enzyme